MQKIGINQKTKQKIGRNKKIEGKAPGSPFWPRARTAPGPLTKPKGYLPFSIFFLADRWGPNCHITTFFVLRPSFLPVTAAPSRVDSGRFKAPNFSSTPPYKSPLSPLHFPHHPAPDCASRPEKSFADDPLTRRSPCSIPATTGDSAASFWYHSLRLAHAHPLTSPIRLIL
jgi:hypothetical protein